MLGKLTKTICKGSEIYDDGKKALQLAIEEYNQAIIDRSYSHHSGFSLLLTECADTI